MARPNRPKRAFRPHWDNMETLSGASVLVPGVLLPAAFAVAGGALGAPPNLTTGDRTATG